MTEIVRPAIDFCRKRPEIVRNLAKLFIDGLKLNRARFDQRAESIVRIKAQEKSGKISKLTSQQLILKIKEGEKKLNNRFWDEG